MGVFRYERDKTIHVDQLAELLGDLKNFVLRANLEQESLVQAQIKGYFLEYRDQYKDDPELMYIIRDCENELIKIAREEIGFISLKELCSDAEKLVKKIASYISYIPDNDKMDAYLYICRDGIENVLRARQQIEVTGRDKDADIVEDLDEFAFEPLVGYIPTSLLEHIFTADERVRLLKGEEVYIKDFKGRHGLFAAFVKYGETKDRKTGEPTMGFEFRFD